MALSTERIEGRRQAADPIIYVVKVGYKMAKSLTSAKSLQEKFPGKNRIRKIREKSGYQIFVILGQISRMDSINYHFMV